MKTNSIFLILFFACQALFAQTGTGISIQGIARDAEKAALVDETLVFVFEIVDAGGVTSYYKEDITIKTDPYGVFSHIIGTGNKLVGSAPFDEIPFGLTHMKLNITVNYKGNTILLSNNPFQFAPYAKSAGNGVPTGTIVAFAGAPSNVPAGWVLCDGRDLVPVAGTKYLRELIGNNAPDLRGMFLRGTGTSLVYSESGPALRATQDHSIESHSHTVGTLDVPANSGTHVHNVTFGKDYSSSDGDDGNSIRYGEDSSDGSATIAVNGDGGHDHSITGATANTGITETRPINYGVNYIIKL
jgi:microcystin-dependent protein